MQGAAQNSKQIQAIPALQRYIPIPFCQKNAEEILRLPKKKKETTALFPENESMLNIPSGL